MAEVLQARLQRGHLHLGQRTKGAGSWLPPSSSTSITCSASPAASWLRSGRRWRHLPFISIFVVSFDGNCLEFLEFDGKIRMHKMLYMDM